MARIKLIVQIFYLLSVVSLACVQVTPTLIRNKGKITDTITKSDEIFLKWGVGGVLAFGFESEFTAGQ
jgi:hypothetical protein